MWIRTHRNADLDCGSASASTRIRIQRVKIGLKELSENKFNREILVIVFVFSDFQIINLKNLLFK